MTSQDPTRPEALRPISAESTSPAVFSTAHLVWLDLESGDELSIEIVGPRLFLEDLMAQGFALLSERADTSATDVSARVAGRIEARAGMN